ncbi:sulfatase-like hydrolase/transferase [Singulisphaera sp. PoT]|uniref:sulfatase-like hydrolase/transferase n=1 Tax=Singulisphaera sp. PoT TaxID=3411797 RepID=UPI003BF59D0B
MDQPPVRVGLTWKPGARLLLGCIPWVLLGIWAQPASVEADEARRPNILFLLTDDQRPDTVDAPGVRIVSTPNLDRLARRGTRFTRAISPYPLCVPSRAEILSGCSAFRNGFCPPFSHQARLDLTTWPEAMRRAGYHAWYVGKWHSAGRPTTRGYERSLGLFGEGLTLYPPQRDSLGRLTTGYPGWVFQDDAGKLYPERGVGLSGDTSATLADAAITLLDTQPREPFFLHVNFTAPHDPLIMPPGYVRKYRPEDIPLPPNFLPRHPFDHGSLGGRDEELWPWPRTPEMVKSELAVYYAVISHMDEQIGRILDALDRNGQAGDTIVVFSSDHGLAIGSHGLRGKQNMYEHTVGVPLILAGPGIPKGQRCDAQVYLRELYPTLCDLAGVPIPASVEARSFVSVLGDPKTPFREYAFAYYTDTQRMVRGDRWKLIDYPKIHKQQLFDLREDPAETFDLSEDPGRTDTIRTLRTALDRWQDQVGDPLRKSLR